MKTNYEATEPTLKKRPGRPCKDKDCEKITQKVINKKIDLDKVAYFTNVMGKHPNVFNLELTFVNANPERLLEQFNNKFSTTKYKAVNTYGLPLCGYRVIEVSQRATANGILVAEPDGIDPEQVHAVGAVCVNIVSVGLLWNTLLIQEMLPMLVHMKGTTQIKVFFTTTAQRKINIVKMRLCETQAIKMEDICYETRNLLDSYIITFAAKDVRYAIYCLFDIAADIIDFVTIYDCIKIQRRGHFTWNGLSARMYKTKYRAFQTFGTLHGKTAIPQKI